jgi:NTP pyrophosphatase (non-canonical NTP hydrolase)
MGLAGEAGETVDLLKKSLFHGKLLDLEKLRLELGDVLYYVTWIANLYNIGLTDILAANMDKLQKRFPDGFSHEAANAKMDEKVKS